MKTDDNGLDTCRTFQTESEARAFMLGFYMAAREGIFCRIDAEEPETVLIDFADTEAESRDEAYGHYLSTIAEFNASKPVNTVSFDWSIGDVQGIRQDLTDEQAMDVLLTAKRQYDASIGINWTVLETHADMMFPRKDS